MSVITTDQCILSGALKLYGSLLNSFPRLGFCLPRAGQGRWKQNLPKLLPAERSSVECEISLGGWWQEEHGQWISPLREPIHWPPGPGGMQQWRGLSPRSWWSCPFRTSWGRLVTWKELVELSPPQIQVPYNTGPAPSHYRQLWHAGNILLWCSRNYIRSSPEEVPAQQKQSPGTLSQGSLESHQLIRGVTPVRKESLEYDVTAWLDLWEIQATCRPHVKCPVGLPSRGKPEIWEMTSWHLVRKNRGVYGKLPICHSLFLIAWCAWSQKLASQLLLILAPSYVFMFHILTSMV